MNKKESEENIWEIIGFIKVSSSRYKTIKSLSGNDYKMPSEIAKETNLRPTQVSSALNDLKSKKQMRRCACRWCREIMLIGTE